MESVDREKRAASAGVSEARATEVFYDGACPICRREIGVYRGLVPEGAVAWRDVSQAGEAVAHDLSRQDALARFHARRADGSLVSGARAFLAVWRNVGLLRYPAAVLERRPFIWFVEGGYRAFLRLRKLWRPPEPGSRCRDGTNTQVKDG
jgi:predicted DCC family thiol-disulfide oxidoreductase YuxK